MQARHTWIHHLDYTSLESNWILVTRCWNLSRWWPWFYPIGNQFSNVEPWTVSRWRPNSIARPWTLSRWQPFLVVWSCALSLLENQALCHYTLPLKSNFNGMGLVPFHHTLTIVKGSTTMPPFWLPEWNGTHAIPLYNGCRGKERDNATFFTT
jgi:hypothetical protein